MTEDKRLMEVRCPLPKINHVTKVMATCNNLCVKVYPPSSGETYCTRCKASFEFEVGNQATVNTRINVKSHK